MKIIQKKSISSGKKIEIENEGDLCRKWGQSVVKKTRKATKKIKEHQTYYYEYTLFCPSCKTLYLTEDAKREIVSD